MAEYEEFLKEHKNFDGRERALQLYFELRHFINIHERLDEKYLIYTDYAENGNFRMVLKCMDPSGNLAECLKKGRSAVFFSATLLPVNYYREQLGGGSEDYAVYAPTPFAKEKRLLMVGTDVSTKYTFLLSKKPLASSRSLQTMGSPVPTITAPISRSFFRSIPSLKIFPFERVRVDTVGGMLREFWAREDGHEDRVSEPGGNHAG